MAAAGFERPRHHRERTRPPLIARTTTLLVGAVALAASCGSSCRPPSTNKQAELPPTSASGGVHRSAAAAAAQERPLGELPPARRSSPPVPVQGHPRLWITAQDLPRLRARARASNPIYREGLAQLAQQARRAMDSGKVPGSDGGVEAWTEYPTEMYAELFAFLALIAPEADQRSDFARRARTLLMHAIGEAAKGPAAERPFRDPLFATRNRSRWWGESFGLTVDWIYPHLTARDKATIRRVFLRWCGENMRAQTTDHNHPEPVGVTNDPVLVQDPRRVRWAANNYFNAHMRNIALMALALDPADDPGGTLRKHLDSATGAWLYMLDHVLRTDARGGLGPEGPLYSPAALGYAMQLLLALHTAGQDDPRKRGRQVDVASQPFWQQIVPAFWHTVSPAPVVLERWVGPVFQPAPYGDVQKNYLFETIDLFGPLALYDERMGNTQRLQAIRWLQTFMPPGGAQGLPERLRSRDFREAILYFLLFDPATPPPRRDPRLAEPLVHHAAGIDHIYARTDWSSDATWFRYQLGWLTVDHQHGDGNHFGFYRRREWLTKERTGWAADNFSSDYHNTLALQNDPPTLREGFMEPLYQRGSQHIYGGGHGKLLAKSLPRGQRDYLYVLGDATSMYNSPRMRVRDIAHASRSLLWLRPDRIFVYDRAESRKAGRFKRWFLQLPAACSIHGQRTQITTPRGQRLYVTTLLPRGARPRCEHIAKHGRPAEFEPMTHRLRVEELPPPRSARFLHVLQGADAGTPADAVELVQTSRPQAFVGARSGAAVVLFPVTIGADDAPLSYRVSSKTKRHLITGLRPGARYDVELHRSGGGAVEVRLRRGTQRPADEGGVLDIR